MQPVKVNFERKLLKSYLELLQMAQAPKATLPVLNYFKIGLGNGKLMAAASSLELSIKMVIGKATGDNFSMLIDPKIMIAILNKSSEINVTLQFEDNGVTLLEGLTGEYFFPKEGDAKEFPVFPKVEGESHTITLNGSTFRNALYDSGHFIGSDALKAFLSGISLSNQENGLEAFSSDSHSMFVRGIAPRVEETFEGCIWPKRFTYMLTKLLPDTPVNLSINKQNTLIGISETTVVHARNLEGNIVYYHRVIPAKDQAYCIIEANRIALTEIVDKAGLIAPITQFHLKNSMLTIKGENMELSSKAEGKITVSVIKETPELIMSCNHEILLKTLNGCKKEKVQIEFFPRQEGDKIYTHSYIIREEATILMGMCIKP